MPAAVRLTLIAISLSFLAAGVYYRIQSLRSGERLDRKKEGWPILIGLRLLGLLTLVLTARCLSEPEQFRWASLAIRPGLRWAGVAGFACAVCWLIWMFHTLGRNLTDTVVTRRNAYFVEHGPYRFVRNPMYTGLLMASMSLGLALGTWLVPVAGGAFFALLVLRTRTEEKYLVERFGDQYRDYMRRVGRFFPKRRGST